jgi:hypothetical protein
MGSPERFSLIPNPHQSEGDPGIMGAQKRIEQLEALLRGRQWEKDTIKRVFIDPPDMSFGVKP